MRDFILGVAQMGPVQRADSRADAVARMIALLDQAKARGCGFVVFPELALTTFFPRWVFEPGEASLEAFFEETLPGSETLPLFEAAAAAGIGFYLGYAEKFGTKRFNSSVLVDRAGRIVGKYRKVHLPGHAQPDPTRKGEHLEKRYFDVGDLGFPVYELDDARIGMAICNDRRWPETYRVMGLQGAELIALGYNTPTGLGEPYQAAALANFHNRLTLQAGAYQNACWVAAAAKCGCEEGFDMIGQSMIVSPNGEVVAMAATLEDELISARCDLAMARYAKQEIFNFQRHRRPEAYGLIVERTGAGNLVQPERSRMGLSDD
ncbi:MAG: N-carbamoyl-D-amino-acid hydrolase [Rhodospirillales bacterium]